MAQKAETVFRNRVMPKFKALPKSYWMSIQQKGIFGSPDVIGCVDGFFISLEFKKDAVSKPTALQEYKKERINACGGFAFIIHPDNWEDILSFLLKIPDLSCVFAAHSSIENLYNRIFNNPNKEN